MTCTLTLIADYDEVHSGKKRKKEDKVRGDQKREDEVGESGESSNLHGMIFGVGKTESNKYDKADDDEEEEKEEEEETGGSGGKKEEVENRAGSGKTTEESSSAGDDMVKAIMEKGLSQRGLDMGLDKRGKFDLLNIVGKYCG